MKNKIISAMLLLSVATVVPAYAEIKNVTVKYNRTTGFVEEVSGESDGESISLSVVKPGTDFEKLDSGEESFSALGVYADEAVVSGGGFSFEAFKLTGTAPADYTLRLSDGKAVVDKVIYYASESDTLTLISNNQTAAEVESNINRYNDTYNLSVAAGSLFAGLSDANRQLVFTGLCNKTFTDVSALNKEFNVQTVLAKVYQGPWGELESVITSGNADLGINLTTFSVLSQNGRDYVMKEIAGKKCMTAAELETAIGAAAAVAGQSGGTVGSSSGGSASGGRGDFSKPTSISPSAISGNTQSSEIFTDISGFDWAKDSIESLYKKGVISGRGQGIFAPGDFVTRSEAVKMIVASFFSVDETVDTSFADVPEDHWAYKYIATAEKYGIISGKAENIFGVQDSITREDFVAVLYRTYQTLDKITSTTAGEEFSDADEISQYAKPAVDYFKSAGTINGTEGRFLPKNNITRAEVSVILWNCLK